MPKFSLKTLLVLTTIVALVVTLAVTQRELADKSSQLESYRNEMRYLSISDANKINAISIPGFGRKSWRWRIHLPKDRQFRLRLAFDDIPMNGLPENVPDKMFCDLPPGESLLSVSLVKENGEWGVGLYSETEGRQNFDFVAEASGKNTAWLDKRGGVSKKVAGSSSTLARPAKAPYILLSYRDALSPKPGETQTNPEPTDGVLVWIQESK
ncbi:hypothetical protein Pla108_27720 [Botrimarina colliarenosi]|uniref:Uncharacterized protein n=1 Tax=Botrimarina colliarenosi TaxID=2528001 RepID=A0A5C6ACV6_9BACT|nr:hypothetical protein [Botrimarina colliarenosi]TWT96995.1 hypothetical protein Pla108_27720 [Botrimarina colliarenosi]